MIRPDVSGFALLASQLVHNNNTMRQYQLWSKEMDVYSDSSS